MRKSDTNHGTEVTLGTGKQHDDTVLQPENGMWCNYLTELYRERERETFIIGT